MAIWPKCHLAMSKIDENGSQKCQKSDLCRKYDPIICVKTRLKLVERHTKARILRLLAKTDILPKIDGRPC